MDWIIDTSIWVAVERGKISAADIHAITGQGRIFLSPVNVAELQFGWEMLKGGTTKTKAAAAVRRLRRKPQLRITTETGEVFGTLAARMRDAGRGADFRINDLWLAAQAIQRGMTLLTSNARDFQDIPGLKLVAVRI